MRAIIEGPNLTRTATGKNPKRSTVEADPRYATRLNTAWATPGNMGSKAKVMFAKLEEAHH